MGTCDVKDLVGRRVRVSLFGEGVYVGEVLELADAAWRGRVRITGVVSPATATPGAALLQRGHRPGEFVEVDETCLAMTTESGHVTYLEALQAEINRTVGSHSGHMFSPDSWLGDSKVAVLKAAHHAEAHRIVTGKWRSLPTPAVRAS